MDADRYNRLTELFQAALDHPPEARVDLLRGLCDGDEGLLTEVLALFAELDTQDDGVTREGMGAAFRDQAEAAWGTEPAPAEPPIPESIGEYRVIGRLGEGGMGVVYEAEQEHPRRRVAIKLLRPAAVTPSLLARFRREAQILAHLQHPGIARVYDAGQDRPWGGDSPEVPYLVMELVDGEPLTAHASARRLGTRERLELLAEVCDAVQHAHERGIVHRDLKPANVLVDGDGRPRVLDFGVARALDTEATKHTASSQLVGTLPYMSPEQFTGRPEELASASDVYALGVLAYELLAGRQPLVLAGLPLAEAIRRVEETDPERLGVLNSELSGDVEAIVAKALEKEPHRRYTSAAELGADLRRHLGEEPILARPQSTIYRAGKFVRRNRSLAGAVFALIAVLVLGTGVSGWLAFKESRARLAAEAAADELRQAGYRAQLSAALEALHSGDAAKAQRHLDQAPESLRGWVWRHAWARLDDSLERLDLDLKPGGRLGPGPNGTVIASTETELVVVDVGDGMHVTRRIQADICAPSLDGRWAGLIRSGQTSLQDLAQPDAEPLSIGPGDDIQSYANGLWLVSNGEQSRIVTETGELVHVYPVAGSLITKRTLASAPDASWFTVGTEALGLTWVDPDSGRTESIPGNVRAAAVSPDGDHLIIAKDDHLHRYRVEGFVEEPWPQPLHYGSGPAPTRLAISPDGERILTIARSGEVSLWRMSDGMRVSRVAHVAHRASFAWFSPDSSSLVVPDKSGWLRVFDGRDGEPSHEPRVGHRAIPQDVIWLEDGERMLGLDAEGTLLSFVAPGRSDFHVLADHTSYVYDVEFSPDGRQLLSASWDLTARVWDVGTGRLLETYSHDLVTTEAVAFDPQGPRIVSGHREGLLVWERGRDEPLAHFPQENSIIELAYDDEGQRLVATEKGLCRVLNGQDLSQEILRLSTDPELQVYADLDGPGRRLVSATGTELRLHELPSGRLLWERTGLPPNARRVKFNGDGSRIALVTPQVVIVFRTADGERLREFEPDGGGTFGVAFHPSLPMLATGSQDGAVRLWDLESGERIAELPGHRDYVYSVAFSPNGEVLASGSGDTTIRLWHSRSVSERLAAGELD